MTKLLTWSCLFHNPSRVCRWLKHMSYESTRFACIHITECSNELTANIWNIVSCMLNWTGMDEETWMLGMFGRYSWDTMLTHNHNYHRNLYLQEPQGNWHSWTQMWTGIYWLLVIQFGYRWETPNPYPECYLQIVFLWLVESCLNEKR